MTYYSYCCGKYVDRLEGVHKRGDGYICSRCKKAVTIYGNPKTEEEKQSLKDKCKVKGRGHQVLPNGDLQLIDILYKYANENTKPNKRVSDKYVVVDEFGNYLTTILLEHDTGAFYEVREPFENRLIKERLSALSLSSANSWGYRVADLKRMGNLRPFLEKLGWRFRADGRIK